MVNLHDTSSHSRWRAGRWRGTGALLALLGGIALTAGGCSLPGDTGGPGTAASRTGGPISTSAGPAQRGQGSATNGGQSSGDRTAVGSYSADFARCMRANGVPSFPDPGGQGPFAPGSSVDPSSSTYQAVLNGPCRSLAPPAWMGSGPSIGGGG